MIQVRGIIDFLQKSFVAFATDPNECWTLDRNSFEVLVEDMMTRQTQVEDLLHRRQTQVEDLLHRKTDTREDLLNRKTDTRRRST